MNIRINKLTSRLLLAVLMSVPFIQGCTTAADEAVNQMTTTQQIKLIEAGEDKQFNEWYNRLLAQIKADPTYKRMPVDTKKQELDLYVWLHEAYSKKIAKQELTNRLNSAYPNHNYEISFIVSRLP